MRYAKLEKRAVSEMERADSEKKRREQVQVLLAKAKMNSPAPHTTSHPVELDSTLDSIRMHMSSMADSRSSMSPDGKDNRESSAASEADTCPEAAFLEGETAAASAMRRSNSIGAELDVTSRAIQALEDKLSTALREGAACQRRLAAAEAERDGLKTLVSASEARAAEVTQSPPFTYIHTHNNTIAISLHISWGGVLLHIQTFLLSACHSLIYPSPPPLPNPDGEVGPFHSSPQNPHPNPKTQTPD